MNILDEIKFLIPNNEKGRLLVESLCELLNTVDYSRCNKEKVVLGNEKMNPRISFAICDEINTVCVDFGQKNVKFYTRSVKSTYDVKRHNIKKVCEKLKGHVIRVDHVGFNIPSCLYSDNDWSALIKDLSLMCNLYSYPTGKPWPFILPATVKEHEVEIENFTLIREPRFELVYDDYTDKNTIQIDLVVDMTREEVEKLFPKDDGFYFEGLENIFKGVYVDFDSIYDVRLDIRFKSTRDNFSSGEWFVTEGKRVR